MKFCGECGTQLPSIKDIDITETIEVPKEELTRGTTFAGRYEIVEKLSKGGRGRVYRVEDTKLNQEVALKLFNPEIDLDERTIERFRTFTVDVDLNEELDEWERFYSMDRLLERL